MDPLTTISLVANIAQFVELGWNFFTNVKEVRHSASGLSHNDQKTADMMSEMHRLSLILGTPGKEPSDPDEKALVKLAHECRELSQKILELLKKTSARNSVSKSEAIYSTLRKVKYAREKDELEQRLKDYRSQLHLYISHVSSVDFQNRLVSLATNSETQLRRLRTLDTSIEQLQGKLSSLFSSNQDLLKEVRNIVQLTQAARETIAQRQILRSLDQDECTLRYDTVDTAHQDTFQWILEDGSDIESERLLQSRKLFCNWLSKEEGIFHIVGKLGTGKSTLMKFILNHAKTVSNLRKWAGNRRLVLVNFFFWRPGSIWQKSVKGLLRGLVQNILRQCHELIPVAFPFLWENIMETPKHQSDKPFQYDGRSPGDDAIHTALNNILTYARIQERHRFCFFIDALDEQNDPSPQNDHKALVEMIQKWTEHSNGALKVCLSSREDNVFMNAFDPDRRLRLQDITRQDRETYVRNMLPEVPSKGMRARIIHDIVDRSHGIFLWVVLVVKALREAFENGRELDDFETEMTRLPSEIEDLFVYLLQTIPVARRRNAFCLLQLMLLPDSYSVSVYAILYLEKYLKNPRFALENELSSLRYGQLLEIGGQKQDSELTRARKMLQGDCRGLLEIVTDESKERHYIQFTHRSVVEFLQKTSTQEIIADSTRGFDPGEALAQMFLGQTRAAIKTKADVDPQYTTLVPDYEIFVFETNRDQHKRQNRSKSVSENALEAEQMDIRTRKKRGLHNSMYEIVTALEIEMQRKGLGLPVPGTGDFYVFGPSPNDLLHLRTPPNEDGSRTITVTHPYYLLAYLGDLDFVEWKLEKDALLMTHTGHRSLLLACILSGFIYKHHDWIMGPQLLRIVRKLTGLGPLNDGKYFVELMIYWLGLWGSEHYHECFIRSKPFIGPILAAVLRMILEERPISVAIIVNRFYATATLTFQSRKAGGSNARSGNTRSSNAGSSETVTVSGSWSVEPRFSRLYRPRWSRRPEHKIKRDIFREKDQIDFKELIQFLQFDNGPEIISLLDALAAPAGVNSDISQAVDRPLSSPLDTGTSVSEQKAITETSNSDMVTETQSTAQEAAGEHDIAPVQKHIAGLLESDTGTKVPSTTENFADEHDRSLAQEEHGDHRLATSGLKVVYLLFALLGIVCAWLIFRISGFSDA